MSPVNHESIGKSGDVNTESRNSTSSQRLIRASGKTWLEETVKGLEELLQRKEGRRTRQS